jgi:hypothetical protein
VIEHFSDSALPDPADVRNGRQWRETHAGRARVFVRFPEAPEDFLGLQPLKLRIFLAIWVDWAA